MTDTIDRIKASKRKCKHQRDNWKARALFYRKALEDISGEPYPQSRGSNFPEQHRARSALYEADRIFGREAIAEEEKIGSAEL